MNKFLKIVVLAVAVMLTSNANAQLTTQANIAVNVDVSINSSISLAESGALTFNTTTGVTNNITFTTQWNLGPTQTITLYSWFSNPSQALTAGSNSIPSAAISATFLSVNGQGNVSSGNNQPCNQAPGVGFGVVDGASCQPSQVAVVGQGTGNGTANTSGTATTTYSLAMPNYAGLRLGAGNYSGVLNVVVLAI